MQLLLQFLLSGVSVLIVAAVMPGFKVKTFGASLAFAIVVAIFDAIAWHGLSLLTWGFTFVTMGVGFFVINGLIFMLATKVVKGVEISGCFVAAIASLLVALVNTGISHLLH